MDPKSILSQLSTELPGVVQKPTWGETALFYNPGRALPNGVYFCTLKERDGANDCASNLERKGVFRVAFALGRERYGAMFGALPARPPKGGIVVTGHDFTRLDELMPHPVYGWMAWAQILSPSAQTFADILPLINDAHGAAIEKFERRVRGKAAKLASGEAR